MEYNQPQHGVCRKKGKFRRGCPPVCSLSARLKLKNQLKRGEGRKTGSGERTRVFRVLSDWTAQVFSFMSPHEVSRATAVIGLDFD